MGHSIGTCGIMSKHKCQGKEEVKSEKEEHVDKVK